MVGRHSQEARGGSRDVMLDRRRFVAGAAALIGAPSAYAQDNRAIRIIVGFGPGSVADIAARVIGVRMSQTLARQIVVENRAGAGSNLAAEYVTRAPKDGTVLFMATIANTINPAMGPLSFNFAKDLTPITLVASSPQLLVVHPSLGVNTVAELIALAKTKPDTIAYAMSGVGTLSNLSGLLLNQMAGIKLVPVAYTGSAQGVNDVITGRVPLMFGSAANVLPHVQAGTLKALAATQSTRIAVAPHVPTMQESGLPGYDAVVWMGLLAPADTPREIVENIAQAANAALRAKEVEGALQAQGFQTIGTTPEAFADHIKAELKKWAGVASAARLRK
jgi:tripartite-type tricarboxylate transporter receptor subunit TctC